MWICFSRSYYNAKRRQSNSVEAEVVSWRRRSRKQKLGRLRIEASGLEIVTHAMRLSAHVESDQDAFPGGSFAQEAEDVGVVPVDGNVGAVTQRVIRLA